eukprot:1160517-Pelagomonas_calceolata.AAC.7
MSSDMGPHSSSSQCVSFFTNDVGRTLNARSCCPVCVSCPGGPACSSLDCRLAPEAVIQSQLSCLQQGDMQAAELFCDAHRLASGEQGGISLRRLIRQQPYHRLLMVGRVVLGEAANVKEGVFLQAVHLEGGSKQSSALFVWELRLCPDNCWRVRAITHCPSPV